MPTHQYYEDHKEYYKEINKKYRDEHKEERSEYNKKYYQEHIERWEEFHKDRGPRRILFKDKRITLDDIPRTGVCSWCGNTKLMTNIHHTQYDESDPLKHTVEICVSCHAKEHKLGGKT
jgi:hypothetical protein